MTYAEFCRSVTATEFELWVALASVRSDECPHCGVAPMDLMDFEVREIRCPVCRNKYHKTNRLEAELGKVLHS